MDSTTGREPLITADKPGWGYIEPLSNRPIVYTCGYITDEMIPVMALFVGGDNNPILIPLDVMVHAIEWRAEQQEKKEEQVGCIRHDTPCVWDEENSPYLTEAEIQEAE